MGGGGKGAVAPLEIFKVKFFYLGQAENAGMVPRRGNLWHQVNLVNFGVLSSKIVGIWTMGGAFSLFFMIKVSFW